MNDEVRFEWRKADQVDGETLERCSKLFSDHYGVWGPRGRRPGQKVQLKPNRLREYLPDGGWVVLAFERATDELIGYALGVREHVAPTGVIDWVTQLVVHTEWRNRRVAKRLLFCFWGFSDHAGWGLVTSNPFAVRALERITRRRCDPGVVSRHQAELAVLAKRISYVRKWRVDFGNRSAIDTEYFVSHESLPGKLERATRDAPWTLGEIGEGEEWLAFTFREQAASGLEPAELQQLLADSDRTLQDAYARMAIAGGTHPWTRYVRHEVEVFLRSTGLREGAQLLDVGCGNGRHAVELAKSGCRVTALDFVDRRIREATEAAARAGVAVDFRHADARSAPLHAGTFDGALALYDVVGSFADPADNEAIVRNVVRALRPGSPFLISVMSLELTRARARFHGALSRDPDALLRLKPSRTMQSSGQVFHPEFIYIDDETETVYRKEQFEDDDSPPAELVVRDRRYTRESLRALLERAGLRVEWIRPVALGHWDKEAPADSNSAKEILCLAWKQ